MIKKREIAKPSPDMEAFINGANEQTTPKLPENSRHIRSR